MFRKIVLILTIIALAPIYIGLVTVAFADLMLTAIGYPIMKLHSWAIYDEPISDIPLLEEKWKYAIDILGSPYYMYKDRKETL